MQALPPILSDPSELLRRDPSKEARLSMLTTVELHVFVFVLLLGIISEVGVPLPVEIGEARESPPITDTDDSPPPIRRHPTSGTDRSKRHPHLYQ